jgi:hypothetical protein
LTLHWMKNPASSVKAFSLLHDVSENTLMRYIQKTLELIHRTLPELTLNDRYEKWNYSVPCAIIDTKTFVIQQPKDHSWHYVVGRNTYGIDLFGPFIGAASDATIPVQSGTLQNFSNHEALLADKIYKGNQILFLCPLQGNYFTLTREEKA